MRRNQTALGKAAAAAAITMSQQTTHDGRVQWFPFVAVFTRQPRDGFHFEGAKHAEASIANCQGSCGQRTVLRWRCCGAKRNSEEGGAKPSPFAPQMGSDQRAFCARLRLRAFFFFGRPPLRPQRESWSLPYFLAVLAPPFAAMQRGHTSLVPGWMV